MKVKTRTSGKKHERREVRRSDDVEVPLVKRGNRLNPETFGGSDDKIVGPTEKKVGVLLDQAPERRRSMSVGASS